MALVSHSLADCNAVYVRPNISVSDEFLIAQWHIWELLKSNKVKSGAESLAPTTEDRPDQPPELEIEVSVLTSRRQTAW